MQSKLADCFVVPKSDFFQYFFTLVFRRVLYHAVFIIRIDYACMFEESIEENRISFCTSLYSEKHLCPSCALHVCVLLCMYV